MNVLVTLNKNYLKQLIIMLRSLLNFNKSKIFLHVITNDITDADIEKYNNFLGDNLTFNIYKFDESLIKNAPTSKRYPKNIYYRLFAYKILPNTIDKVLYLDPDIIINGNLNELYNLDLKDNYFAGATTIKSFLRKFNEIKNKAPKGAPYLNTGVLLMNLKLLRNAKTQEEIINYINDRHIYFTLPDQDILSAMYGDKIILLDAKIYNLSDRGIFFYNLYNKDKIDLEFVKKNTKIIHYYGRNKPWKDDYHGILQTFYNIYKID